ncbi:MAG: hypothetical protein BGO77_00670 [Caedibacter sp. 37-49]|nr:MAG: hypothetical protein BGO77_00670 [Caedibacter sp. 37-49]
MYNKTKILLLLSSLAITQGTFACSLQEELPTNLAVITTPMYLYSDEMTKLISDKENIVKKYAPDNISRKSFNGLKTVDTIDIGEMKYSISGIRSAKGDTPQIELKRQKFIDSLPHEYALWTNTIGGLLVRGISVDPEFYVQIQYSYTPGPLDRSGTQEYCLTVETPLNSLDKSAYQKITKEIQKLTDYQALDSLDQSQESLQYKPLWNKIKTPVTHHEKLLEQADLTLNKAIENYTQLRKARLQFLSSYATEAGKDKAIVRHFNIQTLEYRKYLSNTAQELSTMKDENKLRDKLVELQSNSSRFSKPLIEFPKWFETKDTKAELYISYYSMWK